MNKTGLALMSAHAPDNSRLKAVTHVDSALAMRARIDLKQRVQQDLATMVSRAMVLEREDLYRLSRVEDKAVINGDRFELDCFVMSPDQLAEFAAKCFEAGLKGKEIR